MLSTFAKTERKDLLLQIFSAIIYTLEKVTTRSKSYLYLGDHYLKSRFNFSGLSELLLSLTCDVIQGDTSNGYELLLYMFKVSEYLSRLIARAAVIDGETGQDAASLVSLSVRSYLKRINDSTIQILSRTSKNMVEVQTAIVQNIFSWFDNLADFVPSDDALKLLIEVIDCIRHENSNNKINTHRLLLIRDLSRSWLYHQPKYRPHITAYTIKWTLPFWLDSRDFTAERKEQLRLLSGIFATQFKILWPHRHVEREVCKRYGQLLPVGAKVYNELLSQFLASKRTPRHTFSPIFPETYPFEMRAVDSVVNDAVFDETLIELGIVFTLLVNIAAPQSPEDAVVIDHDLSRDQLTELSFNIIRACTSMMDSVSFPKTWVSLLAVHHEALLGCLEYLSFVMKTKFIPNPDEAQKFNSTLWFSFLSAILQLAGSEEVAVEHLAEQKRRAVWKISGDIRGRAVVLLKDVWDAIGWKALPEDRSRFGLDIFGGFQIQMFGGETSLVRHVLNLCLVRHSTTQRTAVHILQSMIVGEWTLNEDLTGLQREIIASLDDIFQSRVYLPEEYEKKAFSQLLRLTFRVDREDESYPYIVSLINDIEEFLDLLLDLYNVPPGDAYNDDRIFHALNVLNFLKDIDRVEIFSRYVNDIAEWNRSKLNYTQTGLALQLLASAYDWVPNRQLDLSEFPPFPAQSSFERKEALYDDIIASFTRGRAFENAIAASKELIHAYETITLDFKKLSLATHNLAKLYEAVDSVERLSPQYFRVAYIGIGFPKSLRNRQFIFEGNAWEKLHSIHDRLNKTYPGATIVTQESQAKPDGQYLYVSAVSPERAGLRCVSTASRGAVEGNRESALTTSGVTSSTVTGTSAGSNRFQSAAGIGARSAAVREYQSRLNMRYFSYSRPLPGNTSPLDLWVEKTTYETYQAFPTIVRRSEVKSMSIVKLSPMENALNLLESKTADLVDLEAIFNSGKADQGTVSKLDLVLSGAVDSPVNGGIQVYRTFLEDSSNNLVGLLEEAFLGYASAIFRCLTIHGRVVPQTLRPLHQSLVELFSRNFAPEITTLGLGSNIASMSGGRSKQHMVTGSVSVVRSGSISTSFDSISTGTAVSGTSRYNEHLDTNSELDALLGNAIAASDIMIRGVSSDPNRDTDRDSVVSSGSIKRRTILRQHGH